MTQIEPGPLKLPEPFPGHDGGFWAPRPVAVVARWPAGAFAENLAVSTAGEVLVSLHGDRRIDRFDPCTGHVAAFAHLPAPVSGLCFDVSGDLWATGGEVGAAPGYIWRISPDGVVASWLEIPDALFMNGCTLHGRTLLVCESLTGRVLAVQRDEPEWKVWLEHERLRPTSATMPGANGVKLKGGFAYLSVTDRNEVLRVGLRPDGSAGVLEVFASSLRADDFAFGQSGALYIATHPANSVVRVTEDGVRSTIAGALEGLVGATACAFGRGKKDSQRLYVTTNGGLYRPYEGVLQEAKLVCIEVGEAGL